MSIEWIWARKHLVEHFITLKRTNLEVVIVLTEAPAEDISSMVYVWFEPEVDVVVALSLSEKRISISYTYDLWPDLKLSIRRTEEQANVLLKQGRLEEALVSIAGGIGEFPETQRQLSPLRVEEGEPQASSTVAGASTREGQASSHGCVGASPADEGWPASAGSSSRPPSCSRTSCSSPSCP